MDNPIPYGRQHITEEDIQAVVTVLKSDYLTQGPNIYEFEAAFADYVGSKFAVAVSNGTAALHLSCLALGIEAGDNVITTPITFAASSNCVRYCGGEVVFADIDPETYLLDIDNVRELLEASPKGTYKGIIPVDFSGRAVDLEAFRKLAEKYDLWIIEDSCHAPGGFFTDSNGTKQFCGNGNFADLAIFSFHPVKHIACGEGGMITTNDKDLYEKLIKLRTHGITKNTHEFQNSINTAHGFYDDSNLNTKTYPGWYMEMQTLGFNYRLTDIQAALGLSQLSRAKNGLKRRKTIAEHYHSALKKIPQIKDCNAFTSQSIHLTDLGHAYHLYVIEANDRLGLYKHLRENKIYSQIHYIPVHLMPYYKNLGWKQGDFPNAESYYHKCLSLPMYPSLSDSEQQRVINLINEFYSS